MLPEGYEYLPGYSTEPEYEDDMIFDVDFSTKTTTLIKSQTLIAGEGYSQAIFFDCPRYFDGIDLTTKKIQVPYIGASGFKDISKVVNAAASDERIRFAWVVPTGACIKEGTLKFYLEFIVDDGNYTLKTQIIELVVYPSFESIDEDEPVEHEWYIELQNNVNDALANVRNLDEYVRENLENIDYTTDIFSYRTPGLPIDSVSEIVMTDYATCDGILYDAPYFPSGKAHRIVVQKDLLDWEWVIINTYLKTNILNNLRKTGNRVCMNGYCKIITAEGTSHAATYLNSTTWGFEQSLGKIPYNEVYRFGLYKNPVGTSFSFGGQLKEGDIIEFSSFSYEVVSNDSKWTPIQFDLVNRIEELEKGGGSGDDYDERIRRIEETYIDSSSGVESQTCIPNLTSGAETDLGKPISSSDYSGRAAYHAFSTDSTQWSGDNQDAEGNHYIGYQFKESLPIAKIDFEYSCDGKTFALIPQGLHNGEWIDLITSSYQCLNDRNRHTHTFEFEPVMVSSVRLLFTTAPNPLASSNYGFNMWHIGIYKSIAEVIRGHVDLNKYVNELTKNAENYSLEEQRIGTWVDGKPLYRKVYNLNDSSTTIDSSFLPSEYTLISVEGAASFTTGNRVAIPDGNMYVFQTNSGLQRNASYALITTIPNYIIVLYTKVSD